MNEYPILFTEKYLDDRFAFNDFTIPDADAKIKVLQQWEAEIRNRTIYNKKEEQLQSDFLNDVFGEVLGYAYKRGLEEYNLEKEEKSKTDGTKPDGVLGYLSADNKDIRVVIELKDAYTNLDHKQNRKNDNRTPVEQAFSYVAKSGGNCKWVVVSNFIEIRLYPANDSSFYQRFMVKDLVRLDVLKSFYALLAKNQLFLPSSESVVDKLLQHKIEADTKITKDFYNDYRKCRSALFNHIKENNPDADDNIALAKSQKILDRIIFICFCEDIGLLPYKVFKIILEEAQSSRFDVRDTKLWERTKALFSMIDKGYPTEHINRFNGGLFKDDEVIDNFVIKDSVLADIIALEGYDFESDLNVNILGHIFEQSITDLEELKASFRGETIDKKKGKRKKDGIFYTPEYITKYIVSEAVGGWLEDKKHELGYDELPKIDEEQWIRIRKGTIQKNNQTIKKHLDFWLKYRDALNNIKVLDPACGSGSFLVQVFDYLKEQQRLVNEEIAILQGLQPDLFNNDSHILSHNIYGVDLNAESVEITKLALWLKTANKNDPLTSLDDNIKCGNSLVDDATIDTEHAFDWNKEFSEIMSNGGFDVVVGNPPYVFTRELISEKEKAYYNVCYLNTQFKLNTYILFVEKGYLLLNNRGKLGYIIPNNWLTLENNSDFRKYIIENTFSVAIVNCLDAIFEDAAVDTSILIFSKVGSSIINFYNLKNREFNFISSNESRYYLDKDKLIINPTSETYEKIIDKIEKDSVSLDTLFEVKNGVQCYTVGEGTPTQTKEMKINRVYHSTIKADDTWIKYIDGIDMNRYFITWENKQFVKYGNNLSRKREPRLFEGERLIVRQIPSKLPYSILSSYVNEKIINDNNGMIVKSLTSTNIKYLQAIISSKLISFWFIHRLGKLQRRVFPQFKVNELRKFPIKDINTTKQKVFIELADVMLSKHKEIQELSAKFLNMLKGDFKEVSINNTLTNWYELDWNGFLNALKKQKIVLSGTLKEDWYDRFNRFATDAKAINSIISETDKQIDAAVYKLYNLTDAEIKVIEEQA